MFSYKRADRVRELMLEEISAIIRDEVKDPGVGFVTVTAVEVTGNLRHANVFISPMGTDKEMASTFNAIDRAASFIRNQLGKRIRMKYLPELSIKWDRSPEEVDKINRILHSLEEKPAQKSEEGIE